MKPPRAAFALLAALLCAAAAPAAAAVALTKSHTAQVGQQRAGAGHGRGREQGVPGNSP